MPDKVEVRVHHRSEPLGIEQRLRLRADRRKRRIRAELGVQPAHGGVKVAEHLDRAEGHAVALVALFLGLDADVEERDREALEQRHALLAGFAARGDLAGVGVRHKVEGQARVRGADNVCHRAAALGVERGLRVRLVRAEGHDLGRGLALAERRALDLFYACRAGSSYGCQPEIFARAMRKAQPRQGGVTCASWTGLHESSGLPSLSVKLRLLIGTCAAGS